MLLSRLLEVEMESRWLIVLVGVALGAVVGCGQKADTPRPEEIAAQKVEQAMEAGRTNADAGRAMVKVSREGTRFDPPVQPSQIPPGAWYCDMGTVHYASLERGDGVCPECGMPLTRQPEGATGSND